MQDSSMYDVTEKAVFDNSTESYEYNIYYPSLGSDLNGFSDLRIHVQGRDYFYHPSNAYLTIKGQLLQHTGTEFTGTEEIALINNAPLFLFSKMTYRVGGRDIEIIENVGQTSSMCLHLQNTSNVAKCSGLSACWFPDTSAKAEEAGNIGFGARKKLLFTDITTKGKFCFRIPLKSVFGFCSDFDKLIFNYDHELVMLRQNDCYALYKKTEETPIPNGKIDIKSITLHMPIVTPTISTRMKLLEVVKNKIPLSIHFRERRGQAIDITSGLLNFDWQFSCIGLPNRPKFLLVGLQKTTATTQLVNYGLFTNGNVSQMSVSVNSKKFRLHENTPANFGENDFTEFYRSYIETRENLCGIDARVNESHMSPSAFKSLFTIYCFDLSKHREEITQQTVTTVLHINFKEATTQNIRCFVTSLSDKEIILQSDGKQIVTM